ncbi:MAG: hypothetical protein RL757_1682 [Bacteroidota bacterium]|jgi:hypothetical protein
MKETFVQSEGQCAYCKEILTQKKMSKHLEKHLKEKAIEKTSPNKSFHIRVEEGPYFLNLLVDANAQLVLLDDFLRAIWLECCGHMSTLMDKSKKYDFDFDDDTIGEDMSQTAKQLFQKGQKLKYEYDMGSTTRLDITVLEEYSVSALGGIQILSRNEPLKLLCHLCNEKPAVKMCSIHNWNEPSLFCKSCSTKHKKECDDFADYSAMPIVNSPRMGICGYEGGRIDKKRDAAWKG